MESAPDGAAAAQPSGGDGQCIPRARESAQSGDNEGQSRKGETKLAHGETLGEHSSGDLSPTAESLVLGRWRAWSWPVESLVLGCWRAWSWAGGEPGPGLVESLVLGWWRESLVLGWWRACPGLVESLVLGRWRAWSWAGGEPGPGLVEGEPGPGWWRAWSWAGGEPGPGPVESLVLGWWRESLVLGWWRAWSLGWWRAWSWAGGEPGPGGGNRSAVEKPGPGLVESLVRWAGWVGEPGPGLVESLVLGWWRSWSWAGGGLVLGWCRSWSWAGGEPGPGLVQVLVLAGGGRAWSWAGGGPGLVEGEPGPGLVEAVLEPERSQREVGVWVEELTEAGAVPWMLWCLFCPSLSMEVLRSSLSSLPGLQLLCLSLWLGPGAVGSGTVGSGLELLLLHTNDVHARVEETSVLSGACSRSRGAPVLRRRVPESRGGEAAPGGTQRGHGAPGAAAGRGGPVPGLGLVHVLQRSRGRALHEPAAVRRHGPHVSFEDELAALQTQVDKLQTLGVNKIIALGHSGFTVDKEIARSVRGVDVVIGGHTNTFLYTGAPPSVEVPAGPYPVWIRSVDGRQVPVVQAYAFGKYLGKLRVRFDSDGNVLEADGNPVLLDESVEPDPQVQAQVDSWKQNLKNFSSSVVGKTLVFLNGSNEECRWRECNLGNLICDAMVENALGFSEQLQWNHVSAAVFNGGGVRNSIDEETRNGSITVEDLLSVLPFGGTFDIVTLRGSTLRKAFEHSVHRYGQSSGEFLQVSGLQVTFDLSRPAYSRVRSLRILCTRCRVPSFDPVQDGSVYKVLMPSYLVSGGDGFSVIRDELVAHNSGDLDVSVVSSYISKRSLLHPSVEGRIRLLNSASSVSVCVWSVLLLPLVNQNDQKSLNVVEFRDVRFKGFWTVYPRVTNRKVLVLDGSGVCLTQTPAAIDVLDGGETAASDVLCRSHHPSAFRLRAVEFPYHTVMQPVNRLSMVHL
ncbi:hypothetical protein WMY93_015233 [Mugilogobius chulae]|uniref:5'-nucleotidase n=1 Tax=Mugilogobius chulae TaxID=88201 RepID=A0AAW0P0J6_9GOBI